MSIYKCPCSSQYCLHSQGTQPRTTTTATSAGGAQPRTTTTATSAGGTQRRTTTTATSVSTTDNKYPTYQQLKEDNETLRIKHYITILFLFIYLVAIVYRGRVGTYKAVKEKLAADEMSISGVVNESCQIFDSSSAVEMLRREVYDDGRIFDISHRIQPNMPSWGSKDGIGNVLSFSNCSKINGSIDDNSEMKLATRTGTHVVAPGQVFYRGFDVDTLDLATLNGPALVVDVPRDTNITAKAMKKLRIPKGVTRVLFRTLNTARRLMWKKEFDTSYVGFMKDGAKWLVDNTDIKLVGVDYLSAAAYDDLIPSHHVFLEGREIILVEGLKLDDIEAGVYTVHCLPLRLVGAEGSPTRCILIK